MFIVSHNFCGLGNLRTAQLGGSSSGWVSNEVAVKIPARWQSSEGLPGAGGPTFVVAHSLWLLAGSLCASLYEPLYETSGCPHKMTAGFLQREWSRENKEEATMSFLTCSWNRMLSLLPILFVRGEPHSLGREIGLCYLKRVSKNLWTYFKSP